MQNLAATSLWELARVARRNLRWSKVIGTDQAQAASPHAQDRPQGLATVMLAAINALSDREGEVTIKAQDSQYGKVEMTIKVTGERWRVTAMPAKRVTRSQRQRRQDRMLFD